MFCPPVGFGAPDRFRSRIDDAGIWQFINLTGPVTVASGDVAVTEPTEIQQGDLEIVFIAYRSNVAFANPIGWTTVATQQSGGNTVAAGSTSIASAHMAYNVRGASAPALTFTRTLGDVAMGFLLVYRGSSATPYDTGSANTLAVASVTATTGTITTAENNELIVVGCADANNANVTLFVSATGMTGTSIVPGSFIRDTPANNTFTQRVLSGTATGADVKTGIVDGVMVTLGATGTIQATSANSARHAMIVGAFKRFV